MTVSSKKIIQMKNNFHETPSQKQLIVTQQLIIEFKAGLNIPKKKYSGHPLKRTLMSTGHFSLF